MGIYLFLFIYIILLSFLIFFKGNTNIQKKLFLFLSFSMMFFIMGFRAESVGTDTSLYCTIFQNNIQSAFYTVLKEDSAIIYSFYNKFVSLFSTNRNAIIVANSFLICTLTATFIYKNSKNVIFPTIFFMTFYHFFSSMNIARQYIAVMIVANAFYFLKNKKAFQYILMCLIATLIHNTAIVSFLLVPYLFIEPNKKNITIYLSIIILALLFLNQIMTLFSSLFTHYDIYFQDSFLENSGQNRKIIITFIYVLFAFVLSSLLKGKAIKADEQREFYLLHIMNFIAIILGFIALDMMLISRVEVYFSIFTIILIPKVFDLLKDRMFYYFIFTLIMFIPMWMQLASNNSGVLPYSNWLFNLF